MLLCILNEAFAISSTLLHLYFSKDTALKKSLTILLTLLLGSSVTLISAPLGAPPQFNGSTQKTTKLKDGQSIVLGKYKSRQDADFQLSSLLDFMDSSSKIVNLELSHGFDYAVKEENGLYVVSIEPFIDEKVLNDVLVTVQTRYPKAHAEKCTECVREEMLRAKSQQAVEQELIENAIAFDGKTTPVEVKVEEEIEEPVVAQQSVTEPASSALPFDTKYIFYGLGGLAFVILLVLIMRKPKKASDKELREMYAQAQALEKELEQEEGATSKSDAVDETEDTVQEEDVMEEAVPKAKAAVQDEPAPTAEPAAEAASEPVVAEEAPKSSAPGALNHKLREPNSAVSTVTKENFKEFEGLRLLIAEDNLINQKVIVGLLKDSGINIKIANDGQECLDILAEDPNYQIILMDAHMPRVDGLEATRLIRANPAYDHITVMALSGDTGADDVRKMRECGMEEQLEKPLKIAALYQALYCYFDPEMLGGPGEELPEIHLDNSLGLEMLGGDIELYHEILREFETLYKDSDDKIELWLKHEDYDRAKALLLDVKGIGESIGTAELTETAEEFREALIAGETARFPKLMNRYRTQLQSILADIAEV